MRTRREREREREHAVSVVVFVAAAAAIPMRRHAATGLQKHARRAGGAKRVLKACAQVTGVGTRRGRLYAPHTHRSGGDALASKSRAPRARQACRAAHERRRLCLQARWTESRLGGSVSTDAQQARELVGTHALALTRPPMTVSSRFVPFCFVTLPVRAPRVLRPSGGAHLLAGRRLGPPISLWRLWQSFTDKSAPEQSH